MQVKKFEAQTIADALKLVKSELGPEAIILSTKNHRKGFGLLSKASVEVTAAVADRSLAKKQLTEKVVPPTTKDAIDKLSASKQAEIFNEFSNHYVKKRDERAARIKVPAPTPAAPAQRYADIDDDQPLPTTPAYGRNGRISQKTTEAPNSRPEYSSDRGPERHVEHFAVHADTQSARMSQSLPNEGMANIQEEIQHLKLMLEELKTEQTAINDSRIPETAADELQVEYQNLLRNGIDKRYATSLLKQVSLTMPREKQRNSDQVVEALAVEIMNGVKVDHPLDFKPGSERRVFALIGPTGVGKTTTIAKLASQAILQKNLRVGLINVDSYKVAALDQLATYAKILNVPFRQASTAAELDRALAEFKPLDLVLIDTSGRSQRDSESLSQMKSLLSECAAVRPILIMSATTRDQELYDIITRFKIFNPSGLIFSKLDETSTFGCIYNVATRTGLPLSYFTVGQRVPEDIEPASRERVVDLILDL